MAQKKIYLIRHGKASMEGPDRKRNLDEEGKVTNEILSVFFS